MIRFPFFHKTAALAQDADQSQLRLDLLRSEARYRVLFEVIDDGFCIIQFIDGPDGPLSDYVHIEANSGYERHTGIPGIVGKTVYDIAPNEGQEWVKIYGDVLRTGKAIRFEREFSEAGRFIEVSATRVEPESLGQVAVLFRDITNRKRAEIDLRASEKLARENAQRVHLALAAGAIVGTWVWDIPTDAFIVDDAFCRAMGLEPVGSGEGLTLETIVTHIHPEDRDLLLLRIEEALKSGGPYAQQYRVKQADGKYHWVEANGRVDLDENGSALTFPGVLIDIGERREVEAERDRVAAELLRLNETLEQRVRDQTAELMKKEEALRQAQKMEAVGQLTGGLAHDFNNLLAAISGSLQIMKGRLEQGRLEDLGRYVDTAQKATARAATLTQRLLAFSRRQSLEPKSTDLLQLTRGMEELVQRTVGPHIEVKTSGEDDVWPTLVDPNQLENALLNLCLNARDAMPGGGQLHIHLANATLDVPAARALGLTEGDYVRLSVSDTGSGMSEQDIARAFDPFFTTKPLGEGTGLGLSMVYGFVQQTGGQVSMRSEVGRGTTVELLLPRGTATAGAAADVAPTADSPDEEASGRTILVVEDEVLVRMVVVDALEDLGFRVLQAGSGPDALEIVKTGVEIDMMLTDVGLPKGMNGRQLAEVAREMRPQLNILFATGYDESLDTGISALPAGFDVVRKPFSVETLTAKVLATLAH